MLFSEKSNIHSQVDVNNAAQVPYSLNEEELSFGEESGTVSLFSGKNNSYVPGQMNTVGVSMEPEKPEDEIEQDPKTVSIF